MSSRKEGGEQKFDFVKPCYGNTPAEPTKKEYAPLPSACTCCQPLCFLSVSWGVVLCCAVHATSATHTERDLAACTPCFAGAGAASEPVAAWQQVCKGDALYV